MQCPFCEDPKENADCEIITELHRPSGVREKKAYAICEACGEAWIEELDISERQLGLKNLA